MPVLGMERTQSKAGDNLVVEWKWWTGTKRAQRAMKSIVRIIEVPDSVDKEVTVEDLETGQYYTFAHATVDAIASERCVCMCLHG
mgnify:CR=1 FL=1